MDRNERIRQRAHEIWEREGRPDGRQDAHWEEACRDIAAAESGTTAAGLDRSRDPDTGAALAGDPTGWVAPSNPHEDLAGEGQPARPAPPRARRKAKPAR